MIFCQYFPSNSWLALLLQGWRLPFIVGIEGHMSEYSIMLWNEEAPAEARGDG